MNIWQGRYFALIQIKWGTLTSETYLFREVWAIKSSCGMMSIKALSMTNILLTPDFALRRRKFAM